MTGDIRLRPEVEDDLLEAAVWYERQRVDLGKEFLDAVAVTLSKTSDFPLAYPTVHRLTRRALLPRFPFGVFFQVQDQSVVVIAILHGSRHPRHWRSRL